ncbi:MAG: AAA family ATPase [Oleispira sp.]|nr:AAA family ATPase [Oleispira sp.]MBL4881368.1 AAA family ATPase [Oleispira sp.]
MSNPINSNLHLIRNANKGNLDSIFQLYENYSSSENEEDRAVAGGYLECLKTELAKGTLIIDSMELRSFRRFEDLKINFETDLTVIVGDNGAGKTSILESISKILSWFNNDLLKENSTGKPIKDVDVNVNEKDYSEISATLKIDAKRKFSVGLARPVAGRPKTTDSYLKEIRLLANIHRVVSYHTDLDLPLMAYYPVDRGSEKVVSKNDNEKTSSDRASTRFDAVKKALDGTGIFTGFIKWFIELSNLSEGAISSEKQSLEDEVSVLEKLILDVYQEKSPSEDDIYVIKLGEKKEELLGLSDDSFVDFYKRQLGIITKAIETLIPDISNIHIDRSSGKAELILESLGSRVNIEQVSKGQQTMIALVADLTTKLVMLNPDAKEPLNGKGIVIIDEIDLHLHPSWQQRVVLDLQRTFPNIQFIISTHSPQVLSTVDARCIRKIATNEKGAIIVSTPKFQTKGVASSNILAKIMGTNSIPENVEEARWVRSFYEYLAIGNREEANDVLEKLIKHFGKSHPVIDECNGQIRIFEMKARLGGV